MPYLVVGFIAERPDVVHKKPAIEHSGVHTPLRQDGYYGLKENALRVADLWRKMPTHAQERVAVVEIVEGDHSCPT